MYLTGGENSGSQWDKTSETVTISPPNAQFGPFLGTPLRGHCAVYINGRIILTGGWYKRKNVMSINADNGEISYMSNTTSDHVHHGCASFSNGNKSFVVVAGNDRTTEILDIEANIWTYGNTSF